MHELDRAGEKISDAIFNKIEDVNLLVRNKSKYTAEISVHRRVYDNSDVASSWTVIDRFHLGGTIPLYSGGLGNLFNSPVGFSLGTAEGLDFLDIRQVLPKDYPKIPSTRKELADIKTESWYQDYLKSEGSKDPGNMTSPDPALDSPEDNGQGDPPDFDEGEWVFSNGGLPPDATVAAQPTPAPSPSPPPASLVGRKIRFIPEDPQEQARYSKLYNMLVFPFRAPLRASAVKRMDPGEIISYVVSGTISLGSSVGWNITANALSELVQAGASFSTYLEGDFRISVMKEDDRFVRVKFMREASAGLNYSLGGTGNSTNSSHTVAGRIVLQNITNQLQTIPFTVALNKNSGKEFDVIYRYDLANPDARKAFNRAVVGRLAMSDRLAVAGDGKPRDFKVTGVKKLSTRHQISTSTNSVTGSKLAFIFNKTGLSTLSNVEARITFPDGTYHTFTSTATNSKAWHTFYTGESFSHNFTISFDLDKYDRSGSLENACDFMMEGRLEDADTHHNELPRYIDEVEEAVGQSQIFPRNLPPLGNTGRSRFYYQIDLNCEQVQKFINFPEDQMWEKLAIAFGVKPERWSTVAKRALYRVETSPLEVLNFPLHLLGYDIHTGSKIWAAGRLFRKWKKLKTITQAKSRAEKLGKMFFDKHYGYELSRLLRSVLAGEDIYYYAAGYNESFGQIVRQGGSKLVMQTISDRVQRELDYDRDGPRPPNSDPDTVIQGMNVKVLDSRRIELDFELEKAPKLLFVQVSLNDWWWPFNNGVLATKVFRNPGIFVPGPNKIIFDMDDPKSPWFEIANKFVPDNIYTLSLGVNNDLLHWGAVATNKFRFTVPADNAPENPRPPAPGPSAIPSAAP